MKILFSFIALCLFQAISAQNLEGSWELISENDAPVNKTTVRIYKDNFFAEGTKKGDYEFINAKGGFYNLGESKYSEEYEFHSDDSLKVGTSSSFDIGIKQDTLKLWNDNFTQTWLKITDYQDDLSGVWIITGRERNGEMQYREIGDRKTIKILSGTRFQWIAYNSATGKFYATGGGTYSAKNGRYIENIEFFSKDDFRVGASLSFDYRVLNNKWNHSGNSSNGDPIKEIWSPYPAKEISKE